MNRSTVVKRDTKETRITLSLNLDEAKESKISTGVGFFDHMLEGFAKHGFFTLQAEVKGDLFVDGHHTVEDTGIALGQAIKQAIGDKKGMNRFGYFILPMDDALALCSIDLGGRAYFNFSCPFESERIGDLETQLIREFFYAVCMNAEMNLHIKLLDGINDHHKAEAIFKAFGKALDMATGFDNRIDGVLSTKGSL